MMERWDGYYVVCPDMKKGEVDIEGDPSTDISKFFKFEIT
jgi:hypothetical protein